MDTPESRPADAANAAAVWSNGVLPANVQAGPGTTISGEVAFKRFHSQHAPALVLGEQCTMDGVQFALGRDARVTIGDYCYFTNAVLLCELALTIGSHVVIGWNTTIADTDFHPLAPALRIADAVACSPLAKGRCLPRHSRCPHSRTGCRSRSSRSGTNWLASGPVAQAPACWSP